MHMIFPMYFTSQRLPCAYKNGYETYPNFQCKLTRLLTGKGDYLLLLNKIFWDESNHIMIDRKEDKTTTSSCVFASPREYSQNSLISFSPEANASPLGENVTFSVLTRRQESTAAWTSNGMTQMYQFLYLGSHFNATNTQPKLELNRSKYSWALQLWIAASIKLDRIKFVGEVLPVHWKLDQSRWE